MFLSMTDNVYDVCLDYYISQVRAEGNIIINLGTSVVNVVCHGHECNILFITVELLN